LVLLLTLTACEKPKKDLSSYESAARWIKAEYSADTMRPESSDIHKVEYYAESPEKWLMVFFNSKKSKGYIYQNFPEQRWEEWKSASSKGGWYSRNLKGKSAYFFKPPAGSR
jgi:hypothetical protein